MNGPDGEEDAATLPHFIAADAALESSDDEFDDDEDIEPESDEETEPDIEEPEPVLCQRCEVEIGETIPGSSDISLARVNVFLAGATETHCALCDWKENDLGDDTLLQAVAKVARDLKSGLVVDQCCTSCCGQMMKRKLDEDPALIGCIFYHDSDLNTLYKESVLFLGFDSRSDAADEAAKFGRLVTEALKKEGFAILWDGSHDERIMVSETQEELSKFIEEDTGH